MADPITQPNLVVNNAPAGYDIAPGSDAKGTADVTAGTAPANANAAPTTDPNRTIYTADIQDTPVAPAKSADQIQQEMVQSAQGEINSINQYAADRLAEQKIVNDKNDRSTSSISTLTGLAGSTEANVEQQKTTAGGQQANKAILNEAQVKIQTLLGNIRQSALSEARNQLNDARLAESDRLTARKNRQDEATKNLTNLAATGVTFDGLKTGDPASFKYLSNLYGGETALKGAFILNTPQSTILDKKIVGDHYVISKKNPITGAVTVENMQIPGLPPEYSKTADLGDRIMFYDPSDPTKQMFVTKGIAPKSTTTPTGNTPAPTKITAIKNVLHSFTGADTYVDPDKYKNAYEAWTADGYDAASFVKNYPPKQYVNPNDNKYLPTYLQTPVKGKTATTKGP